MPRLRFGLILPSRPLVLGTTSVETFLALAEQADDGGWDSVWAGDSLFAKPRLEALVTLGALAARTSRVRIGAACMASTPLRNPLILAAQWATLDTLSHGRVVFAGCGNAPGPSGGAFEHEYQLLGVEPASRMRRLEEVLEIMRLVSSREHASYAGTYYRFEDATVLPHFVQQPLPLWVAANPDMAKPRNVESAYRRVARYADGWMSSGRTADEVRVSLDLIRAYAAEIDRALPQNFEVCPYLNVNLNPDREAAYDESAAFLERYYGVRYSRPELERWVAAGTSEQCISTLEPFVAAGATMMLLRITGRNQEEQLQRLTEEVLPAFA